MKDWISWRLKRVYCVVFGCDVHTYSSAYMPDDWHSPYFCERCEACLDVYQVESTDWPVFFPQESLIGRLKSIIAE